MKKTFYPLLVVVAVALQGRAQTAWIVGGGTAAQGQLPWVGNIIVDGDHYCGASLIHPKWAITAGHCTKDYLTGDSLNPFRMAVRFNSVTKEGGMSPGGIAVGVKRLYPFPVFDLNYFEAGYDIALIELATAVSSVTPIALPLAADTAALYRTGNNVKVAGWGLQDTFSYTSPDLMKWCATRVYDFALCDAVSVSMGHPLSRDLFCAGYTGSQQQAGAAAGDSGGPIWMEDGTGRKTLLGVVSGGFEATTRADLPGYYTKAALYRHWIDSVMATDTTTPVSNPPWTAENIRIVSKPGAISLTFGELGADAIQVAMFSADGREVYGTSIALPSWRSYVIDNRGFSAGLYVMRITGAGGRSFIRKLANLGY